MPRRFQEKKSLTTECDTRLFPCEPFTILSTVSQMQLSTQRIWSISMTYLIGFLNNLVKLIAIDRRYLACKSCLLAEKSMPERSGS